MALRVVHHGNLVMLPYKGVLGTAVVGSDYALIRASLCNSAQILALAVLSFTSIFFICDSFVSLRLEDRLFEVLSFSNRYLLGVADGS